MSGRTVSPRPDQVAELTRGIRLPLEPIDSEHLEIVAETLQRAFDDVRAQAPDCVSSGTEPEVTTLMVARLNGLIQEDRLWGQLVLYVGRGTESISFDGAHLEKRPDLSIVLSGVDRRFPLVAEAKVIDRTAAKPVALYCDNGIRRFVDGEYAWTSREAFMIGYVRDGSSIDATLRRSLSRARRSRRCQVIDLPKAIGSGSCDLASTRHGRTFVYIRQPSPNRPGPISIWHLWLA